MSLKSVTCNHFPMLVFPLLLDIGICSPKFINKGNVSYVNITLKYINRKILKSDIQYLRKTFGKHHLAGAFIITVIVAVDSIP